MESEVADTVAAEIVDADTTVDDAALEELLTTSETPAETETPAENESITDTIEQILPDGTVIYRDETGLYIRGTDGSRISVG